ncbi:MAG TPA: DUF2461 domain-containing protein [Jiangellaceae bacterium]
MTFDGIPVAALDFYEGLEADNTKTYWTEHRHVYDTAVRAPVAALAERLAPEFGDVHLFRPHRDLRFSADKRPYKTQQGATVGPHYFHVSAAGLFVATGYYRMSPDQVARYREAVDDDAHGPALETTVTALRSDGYTIGGERLKTKPRGYDADHPRIELLRHKALVTWHEFGPADWLSTPTAAERVAAAWRDMEPLRAWLDDHVGPSREPSDAR